MQSAFLPRILFVRPAKPFCSWIRVGTPSLPAAHRRGALAYPPTPMAMSGLNSLMIFLAMLTLLMTLNGRAKFESVSFL